MGQHIALAGQVHPEHRPRQDLRDRPFGYDLFFLRHGSIIGKEPPVLNWERHLFLLLLLLLL